MGLKVLAQVTLPAVSGLIEDAVVNTFAIEATDVSMATADDVAAAGAIANFYNSGTGLNNVPASYLSSALSRAASAVRIKLYNVSANLDGGAHGSPWTEYGFTLGAAGSGNDFPSEVALCLTLEGAGRATAPVERPDNWEGVDAGTAVDRPKQRRTGRIFFGPLKASAAGAGTGVRPSADICNDLAEAAVRLDDELAAHSANPMRLCVWSRANEDFYPLEAAFVDNAWDTQRRRGLAMTTRYRLTA